MLKSITKTLFFLIIVSLVIYLFTKELSRFYSLYQENQRIKSGIEELKVENQELKKQITILSNETRSIEKIARDELGMIKQSEKIYKFQE